MVFEYTVKYNGKRYLAGEDVPEEIFSTEEPKVETPNESPVEKAKEVFEQKVNEQKRGRKKKE